MEPDVSRRTDYESIASVFNRRYQDNDYSGVESALRRFLASQSHLDVLDAGCGTAYWLKQLESAERRIIGVDASANMLRQATQRGGCALVHAQAEALPFRAASFDRIFCLNSLHHFTDKHAFVTEAARLLRRGGSFMTVGLDPHTGLD